ncbi:GTPase [endosymbiont GvMRE of Glomus versiforme]|uniref:GTPase n=1 Tax=endosymbiont GvMRE of Glomus versiforme TaxID=2039283 RepID=UPI000ED3B3EA|nr:GTPase [endosymbiont GvMRE of Glomus versiforme]RHZ36505.1 GTPase IMAP family member 4-like [endosymbiont GvMRE of Glomus versiforme]
MNDTKIILLIGRSGRGKSTLANVVTNTNNFKESSGSVSETKEVQFEQFEDIGNKINYAIIDTPGIGDTKMSDNEVLNVIAKAVYLGKDGISQVFFVNDGRFDQYEMATYDLLRTIIFDNDITKHTTIVRTRFPEFRDDEEYQKDIDSMKKEAQAKETELKNNIADKRKEIESLTSGDEQYQKLSEEIKKAEKELTVTNLARIIESCQGRIVYVDNPSLEVKDTNKLRMNKEDREDSREILFEHLKEHCQGDSYKPENLKKLSEDIADDYFQYLNKKAELQRELDEEMKRLNSWTKASVSQASSNQTSNFNIASDQTELTTKENQNEIQEKIIIIEKKERERMIAELQDKKERLKKQIQEKEKIIHQKVLKHIFNNYEAINKELGGNIFLNSVTGEHPWTAIHPEFTNRELVIKWLSQGFDYEQTQNWAAALIDFNPQIDADFCAWLRDKKQLTAERIKRASYPQNIERWRQEYAVYLGKEIGVLDKHKQQLEKRDWADIHPGFAKESFYYKKTYQGCWEENNLTYQDAQNWIPVGFIPWNYKEVNQWKNHNFTPQEVKSWLDIDLDKNDAEFAAYLRGEGHQPSLDLNLKEMKISEAFGAKDSYNKRLKNYSKPLLRLILPKIMSLFSDSKIPRN